MAGNEDTFRPQTFADFVGQAAMKSQLEIHIGAARAQDRMLDHVLLCGPAGSGKTSMAYVIGRKMGNPIECLTMPVTLKTLANVVRMHEGVLILDEVHRAAPKQQEDLLPLLESGYVQTPSGQRFHTDALTIIGTTTEPQKIIAPLFDRFVIKPDIEEYSDEEMSYIVQKMAGMGDVSVTEADALVLGRATAGIPRKARQLVLAMRDLTATQDHIATAAEALAMCRIELDGLTVTHLRYLHILSTLHGTAGLKTLSSLLQLNESVVVDYERLLLKQELISLGDRGRELTGLGARKLRERRADAA